MHHPATAVLQFGGGLFKTTTYLHYFFKREMPLLPSGLLPPRATSTCPQRPLAQVVQAAPAPAFSLAPILIHPEHLCLSLPIGERRMGGVRARPISSQMDTSSPALPAPHLGSTSAHATTAPAKRLGCLLLQPPRSHRPSRSCLPLRAKIE